MNIYDNIFIINITSASSKTQCNLETNSESALASHSDSGGYSTYSCNPCESKGYEVHVLNIYEPTNGNHGFQEPPSDVKTVNVRIIKLF